MGAGSRCTLICDRVPVVYSFYVTISGARLTASRSARETLYIYGFDDVEISVWQCNVAKYATVVRSDTYVSTGVRCVGYINDNVERSDRICL